MTRPPILFFNPVSTTRGKQRLPMSLLAVAAPLAQDYQPIFLDGNLLDDPTQAILDRAEATQARLLAVTTMPGPQLRQAIEVCRRVKAARPALTIVWGGYFPTHHGEACLRSGFVDFVIEGQGEVAFQRFVEVFFAGGSWTDVPSLVWLDGDDLRVNARAPLVPLDSFPLFPYDLLDDVMQYRGKSYLGERVLSHHTSFGCPFACNFCAVVKLVNQRWLPESPARVETVARLLVEKYGADALEFHDMDFFIQEERVAEIAERLTPLNIRWWALGRIDKLSTYSEATWQKIKRSGCQMIFMGAESGDDETLQLMNKGGKSGTAQTLAIVERMKRHNIVPELSFVLGNPPDPEADVAKTLSFIRKVKAIHPQTELILYLYTPTPQVNSLLLDEAMKGGFSFPQTLEEWAGDDWAEKSLRRNPGTPWAKDPLRRRIRNFETVINAYYPTATDMRLRGTMRHLLKALSDWRYRWEIYERPYELKALQRLLGYRRPETMGF